MLSHPHKDDKTDPSSHTAYLALSDPEKDERLRLLHEQSINVKQEIEKLKKSAIASSKEGITVDEELHHDLKAISNDNIDLINSMYPEGSLQ